MNQRLPKSGGKSAIIVCLIVCFVLIIVFSTVKLGDVHAQTRKPVRQSVRQRALFDLRPAKLFDNSRVKYVIALEGESTIEIKSMADLNKVARGSVLVARLNQDVTLKPLEGDKKRIILPYKFDIQGSTGPGVENLRAVAELEQGGLRWKPQDRQFEGSVLIGIANEESSGAPRVNLPNPVVFQFIFNSGVVDPITKNITHTNLPYSQIILVAEEKPTSSKLKIMTAFDREGVEVDIPVILPKVELRAPTTIPGLGYGFGEVIVTLPPNLVGHIKEVTLSIDRGFLDPNPLPISDLGSGISRLRSSGMEGAKIAIVGAHLESKPVYVDYILPWISLILILVGAILSGILFGTTKGNFLVGVCVGLIAGFAYGAGIILFDIDLGKFVTEVGGLVAAAIPGFLRIPMGRKREK